MPLSPSTTQCNLVPGKEQLCSLAGNLTIALLCHRLNGMSTCGFSDLNEGNEHAAYTPAKEFSTIYLYDPIKVTKQAIVLVLSVHCVCLSLSTHNNLTSSREGCYAQLT